MNAKKIKIGDVCQLKYGDSLPERSRVEGSVPVYGSNGIVGYHQSGITSGETIVVGRKGSVGKIQYSNVACFPIDTTYYIDETLLPCDLKWLYYNLLFQNLSRLNKAAAVPGINRNDVYDITINYPDLETQKQIAQVLEDADRARQGRKAANALTEQFLQSSLPHLFGDLVLNTKAWPSKRLDEVATISSGVTKGRNLNGAETITVPYMRVANVQDGFLNLSEIKTIEIKSYELAKYLLQEGDILLTEGGDPDKLGRGAVWQNQIDTCIHQNHIFKVRADRELLTPEFLSIQFGSEYGKRYFLKAAKQTTGIASINSTQLKAFPVLIPPLPLQQHFASLIADAEILRQKQQQSERELEHLFQALLQQYFGKSNAITLPIEEAPHPLAAEAESHYVTSERT